MISHLDYKQREDSTMNINELRQTKETATASQTLTLADLMGKQRILPLPAGLHECVLNDVTSTETSRAFRIVVESTENNAKYAVSINIGSTAESADIAMSIISHFLDQIDLTTFNLADIKSKIGSQIMILGTEKVTDRGVFTNYSFNPAVMMSHLD